MWRYALAGLLVIGFGGDAFANGRAPGTSTIHFKKGQESEIAAGMTFGLLVSHDNGKTWLYMCEDAVGYGGMYDPVYAYSKSGALFATTFNGLKVMRDQCTFGDTPQGMTFVSNVVIAPDDAVVYSTVDKTQSTIYTSCTAGSPRTCNDGTSFPVSDQPAMPNDWWQSVVVAPSNPLRVYLSGYRFANQIKTFLVFRSDDGGKTFTQLPVTSFTVMPNSTIEIVGVSATNPDLVFARVTLEDNNTATGLYRSTNAGASWTRIKGTPNAAALLVRGNGDLVIGTQVDGSFKSVDNGANWTPLASPPHINCLAENSAGEVWACTQNYGMMSTPTDGFGIMKSTDLATWTGVLKFQDIQAPATCPAGTPQHDKCDAMLWGGLCAQLGCDPKRACPGFGTDAAPDAGGGMTHPGSCDSGSGAAPGFLLLGLAAGFVIVRRARRRV
jgi:hypothetical protein